MVVPIGMWMSSYRIVGAQFEPIVDFIRYLPIPALVPLLIIWSGIGEGSKIAVLWMEPSSNSCCRSPTTPSGCRANTSTSAIHWARSHTRIIRDIVLRAMLPSMVDNLCNLVRDLMRGETMSVNQRVDRQS